MSAWLLAAALAAAPLASQAEDAVTQVTPAGAIQVVIGDRITVRLPANGRPEQVSVERAAAGGASPPKPGAGRFDDDVPRGTVVITLERAGPDIMMKVQSGVDKAFDYQARLMHQVRPGAWVAEPTSVCTVLPLLSSYEHWPNREQASGIVLSGFKLRDTNGVVCPKPAKAE